MRRIEEEKGETDAQKTRGGRGDTKTEAERRRRRREGEGGEKPLQLIYIVSELFSQVCSFFRHTPYT